MDANESALTLEQHVAHAEATRERLAGELRGLVSAEQTIYDNLKAQADEAKARRDGYQRALDHIVGQHKAAAAKATAKGTRANEWTPTDAKVQEVFEAFKRVYAEAGEPITRTMVEGASPIGGDTIRKAFEVLRERELVRIAGTTRGGGKLWALMPNEGLSVAA